MLTRQAVTAMVIGALFIVIGCIPGPVEWLRDALRDFQRPFTAMRIGHARANSGSGPVTGRYWLAIGGALAILAVELLSLYQARIS